MKVKQLMQNRLRELEPMPELLHSSDQRLQQMSQQLEQFQRLHERDMALINDLTAKVKQHHRRYRRRHYEIMCKAPMTLSANQISFLQRQYVASKSEVGFDHRCCFKTSSKIVR